MIRLGAVIAALGLALALLGGAATADTTNCNANNPKNCPQGGPNPTSPICDKGDHVGNPHCIEIITPSPSPTPTPTQTPTQCEVTCATPTPTPTPIRTPSPLPVVTPTASPGVTIVTPSPTARPSATQAPTAAATPKKTAAALPNTSTLPPSPLQPLGILLIAIGAALAAIGRRARMASHG